MPWDGSKTSEAKQAKPGQANRNQVTQMEMLLSQQGTESMQYSSASKWETDVVKGALQADRKGL